MFRNISKLAIVALLIGMASAASAQTTVPLPDQTQSSTLTATLGEQCRINVPSVVSFAVTNTLLATNSPTVIGKPRSSAVCCGR